MAVAHDVARGLELAHAIEAGWVQVKPTCGGFKQSGIGREFSLERMLDGFTQRKNVTVNLETPAR